MALVQWCSGCFYGGLRRKSWECQDSADNTLYTKLGRPSESRVRACPRTIDADLRIHIENALSSTCFRVVRLQIFESLEADSSWRSFSEGPNWL